MVHVVFLVGTLIEERGRGNICSAYGATVRLYYIKYTG